jgi:large subunit ribosomal protein L17
LQHRKLNRTSEHRKALLRNMAQNLIEHGKITTTLPKAKTLRPYFEKLVTMAVKARRLTSANDAAGALRARREIHKVLSDRGLIDTKHRGTYAAMSNAARAKTLRMASGRRYRTGEPKGRLEFTAESVTHRLVETVAPRYLDRPGGYTRLIRLSSRRLGDASPLAILQLVGGEEAPVSLTKPAKSARKRRTDARYAMAVKAAKSWASRWRSEGAAGGAKTEAEAAPGPGDAGSETQPDAGPNDPAPAKE